MTQDSVSPGLAPHQAELALAYRAAGHNTFDIARFMGLPESVIHNEVPKYIERKRGGQAA